MKQQRSFPRITVTKKAEAALVNGHPWVYDAELLSTEGETVNGGLVDVLSTRGSWLGTGFLSESSKIRIRLISRNANDVFDESFWERRLRYAWEYRKSVMGPEDISCCRIIFGEADQFPGLTVDLFEDIIVTETLSLGIEKLKDKKKTGELTEDDLKIAEKKMQDLTDKFCKEIDGEASAKEKEIMEL